MADADKGWYEATVECSWSFVSEDAIDGVDRMPIAVLARTDLLGLQRDKNQISTAWRRKRLTHHEASFDNPERVGDERARSACRHGRHNVRDWVVVTYSME